MARITLASLAHSYKPNPRVDADYAVREATHIWEDGGAYALLGPSGCGKTSLLNIISGLVAPTRGKVLFDDRDVTHQPTQARNIAQVFQFPVIYDTMSVRENLAFPLRNRGMEARAIDARVEEIAALLDLTDDLKRKAKGLTADAKQKISLGRGLVRPDVAAILFDEPLTMIDPHLKWELRSKLKAIHKTLNTTMIYVTHDQTEALTFADTVVVMYEGEVVQVGTPQDLFETPDHTFVGYFIGSPGMNVLPAVIEGATARLGEASLSLGRAPVVAAGARVEIGIRPEFLTLVESGGIPARLIRVEDIGRQKILRCEAGPHKLAAILPEDAPIPGASFRLGAAPQHIHVYADQRRVG
jgi:glycerol transport system ATP-binding protein